MSVIPLIFAHNNDQDVVKQRLNDKSSVYSSLKYCISQFMTENEVKFWLGGSSRAPCKMNTWFYFPPMAIHYSLSEGIHFYIQNFLPPTPWIPQTIHFGRLFILRVIHFERDHCIAWAWECMADNQTQHSLNGNAWNIVASPCCGAHLRAQDVRLSTFFGRWKLIQHQSYFYEIYFITSHSYECILLERGPLLVAWLTPASSIPNSIHPLQTFSLKHQLYWRTIFRGGIAIRVTLILSEDCPLTSLARRLKRA